jgi:hypothetical protein
MQRDDMIERLYAKTDLDFDQIESLTDAQMREMLGLTVEPVKPEKPVRDVREVALVVKPVMTGFEFVEHEGALHRVETWMQGSIEQRVRVRCGATVRFQDRTVSASIVLHWLRTGELVKRVPRERKAWQAAIREGAKVKHLGRFATREERDAAVLMYRLSKCNNV